MSYPVLSMIIPCFKHGKYLPDAVHSIFGGTTSLGEMPGQTIKDQIEVIIVDDASPDNTRDIVQELRQNFNNLIYVRSDENKGTPSANNLGIKSSRAPFLTVMSADDMREPTSLEKMLEIAQKNPHSFVYDDTVIFTGGQRQMHEDGSVRVWRMEDYDFDRLLEHNQMHTGIIFPRQAFIDTGGYPEVMRYGREDWAFHVALGIKGYCGIHLLQGGYLYRREGQNRTLTNQSSEWQRKFYDQMHTLFSEIYQGRRPMGCCGGRGANRQQQASGGMLMQSTVEDPLPGSKGMTKVQFFGTSLGKRTFFGPATGTRYSVSSSKNVIFVDSLDVQGLTLLHEEGHYLFKVLSVPQVEQAVSAPAKPQAIKFEEVVNTEPVIQTAPELSEEISSDRSIREIPGLGMTATDKLMAAGVTTISLFLQKSPDELVELTGWKMSRAIMFREAAKRLASESLA